MKRKNTFRLLCSCLLIHSATLVFGQSPASGVALSVGDVAPSLQVGYWISDKNISSFVRDHVYVVDFGATWCTGCVAALPHLNELAAKYNRDVTFISCFVMEADNGKTKNREPIYVSHVRQFTDKRKSQVQNLLLGVDRDNLLKETWLKAADKTGIPYTFVIDRSGKIAWIESDITHLDSMIKEVIKPGYKAYDKIKPRETNLSPFNVALISGDVLDASILSAYRMSEPPIENHGFVDSYAWAGKGSLSVSHKGKVIEQGVSVSRLFYMAFGDTLWNSPLGRVGQAERFPDTVANPYTRRSYGRFWYKPVYEMTDSSLFDNSLSTEKNRFDYFLRMQAHKSTASLMQQRMQRELTTYFGLDVVVEERQMPCWNLVLTDDGREQLRTKTPGQSYRHETNANGDYVHRNAMVQDIIAQLEYRYGNSSFDVLMTRPDRQPPFIDRTGVNGEIDILFDGKLVDKIQAERNFRNTFDDYREVLRKMGFELVKSQKKMKVVVIKAKSDTK